ncbi:TIGR04282 family arsenosugar biosynthesis glycosyltransferase [Prauserella cavernicola]|uniref:DUF2064 domain-containing protein n=1 Tax=Prauserella cavernicola TaxID=2800127 RepID=A0A934QXM8_9PSEU|nr:DUF2064 domain-containing protein [Prauserella cavernicola]MBK1787163.1 DUF2064 domain-containing protein [Prauserella cavernicola]
MSGYVVLVVAKAPVPGLAKTRLCPPATPEQAAELAAASLLDTLDAVRATPGVVPVVALTGDLTAAARRDELQASLAHCTVIAQRGDGFSERLALAHADTAEMLPERPVVQIGMDTPQVTPSLLDSVADGLARDDAVLGPAEDGGWWALALHDPRQAAVLADVPMSRPDTGSLTRAALQAAGLRTGPATALRDVDTIDDVDAVVNAVPGSRFAAAARSLFESAGQR